MYLIRSTLAGIWTYWVERLWYARLRAIDEQLLWPACKWQASNCIAARRAFEVHARQDKAWLALGEDEMMRRIDSLV